MKAHLILAFVLCALCTTSCLFDSSLDDFQFPPPNVGVLEYQDSTVLLIYPDPSWEDFEIDKFHIYKRLKGRQLKKIASVNANQVENGFARIVHLSNEISLPTEFGAQALKSYTNENTDNLSSQFAYGPSTFWLCNKIDENTVRIAHVNLLLRVEKVVLEANVDQKGYSEIREWPVPPHAVGLTEYTIPLSEFEGNRIEFRIKYRNAYSDSEPTSPITIVK